MVGLVIVSHSAQLAGGVKELADQMTQGAVKIAAAGELTIPIIPSGQTPYASRKQSRLFLTAAVLLCSWTWGAPC
ncbi:MAG: hypothetical protein R3C44_15335 [Chloroflexota bacterium]